jgi:DNA (cytosine-5)-methyltransferase 1
VRPRLLDLFCGAGGCSVGYHRAGFDVVGVDITLHPDYPLELIVADAMDVLADMDFLAGFDAIHASPPCPHYSVATIATGTKANHPDLVPPVRELLRRSGLPYVIENVVGAPLVDPVLICGRALGLDISRHRIFETNTAVLSAGCACDGRPGVSIYGHSGEDRRRVDRIRPNGRPQYAHVTKADAVALMGVEWMTNRDDISDAIPPAYTEFIGSQLIDQLEVAA